MIPRPMRIGNHVLAYILRVCIGVVDKVLDILNQVIEFYDIFKTPRVDSDFWAVESFRDVDFCEICGGE